MNSHRQKLHPLVIPINRAFVRRGRLDWHGRGVFWRSRFMVAPNSRPLAEAAGPFHRGYSGKARQKSPAPSWREAFLFEVQLSKISEKALPLPPAGTLGLIVSLFLGFFRNLGWCIGNSGRNNGGRRNFRRRRGGLAPRGAGLCRFCFDGFYSRSLD